MKIIVGLLVAACACQAVFALPAGSPQDDVEIVRPTGEAASTDDFNDFKGVISTGTDDGYPFFQRSPQSFAFNLGFFDAFEDILRRLQARIYPQSVDSSSSDESSSSSVLGRFDFDEGKANKTSTVRVENNLKVVVNDTFYDGDTGLFRVRTVNIRPLDSGEEVVEGTYHHDGSFVPATEGPKQAGVATKDREDADSDEDDSKREPLAKDETENEIRRNADQPESSTTPREPAAQSFLANTDDDGTSDLNAAFVTDNTQGNNSNNNNDEQEPIVSESSRTETNKPANEENSNSAAVESVEVHNNQAKKMEENYQDDSVDAVVGGIDEEPNHYGSEALSNLESGRLTIENNEETEQQQQNDEHDKLNESSSSATKATTDDAAETEVIGEVVNAETNDEQDEQDDAEDAEDTQSGSSGSSEFAAYEKAAEAVLAAEAEEEFEAEAAHAAFQMAKEREDLASSSSDDEDGNFEMNPTFNAEWSEFAAAATADNDKSATNDISNDIDVYDAVPIDLSNDIAVNNWAAAQGNAYPYNPDAEIISDAADRIPTAYNAIPRFERLTINTHHMK